MLYNVVATPGALYRYWRQHQAGAALTRVLLAGTIPGVVAGAIVRVEFLPSPRAFDAVVALVLIPLGAWILVSRRSPPRSLPGARRSRTLWHYRSSQQVWGASAASAVSAADRCWPQFLLAQDVRRLKLLDGIIDLDLSDAPPLGSPWNAVQLAGQAWTAAMTGGQS
jgi:hypothetical protein